ncbi:hypothetical protein Tco_1515514 [Tanacetum coccineum]
MYQAQDWEQGHLDNFERLIMEALVAFEVVKVYNTAGKSLENQANLHAGQQEANQNASTEEIMMWCNSVQRICDIYKRPVLYWPKWPSYSSTNTTSSNTDDKRTGDSFLGNGKKHDHCGLLPTPEANMLLLGRLLWHKMAVLDSCPKHNMVAYLEKSKGNVEFHEIIDFLTRSSIHHALTVSPIVSTTFVEQFWTSAKSKTINNVFVTRQVEKAMKPSNAPNHGPTIWQDEVLLPEKTILKLNLHLSSTTSEVLLSHSLTLSLLQTRRNFGENLRGHSSSDKSLSGNEGDMTIQGVYDLCLSLCKQVSDQAKEIQALKAQITKLKKQAKPRNAHSKGRTEEMVDEDKEIDERILSTEDVVSTDKEGVSTDFEKVSTDRPIVSTDGSKVSTDEQIEGTDEQVEGTVEHNKGTEEENEGTEEIFKGTDGKIKGTEDQTEEEIATQATQTPTSMIFGDDETIAKVSLNMIQAKAVQKKKRKAENEVLSSYESDEELARKMQEEWEAEEERNRIAEENAANEDLIKDFDDIKARIKADRLLAEKLQEQEREQFTIKKTKFLQDTICLLKEIRGLMKISSLLGLLKMKVMIKKMNEKWGSQGKEDIIQNTSEDDSDKENDELRLYLTIAQDEEKEVDYEILDRKYPIKEWKTECLGAKPQTNQAEHLEEINLNVVIRSNGQKRYFSTLMTVLSIFDREDLNAVYQLVMEKYQDEMPEGFDRVLWGDLMVLFNPDDKDEFWSSQLDWIIVSWKLHSSSGIHTLVTDTGLIIHMLVEKKYPLRKEVLMQMLKLKLESEEENTMALELIKFVKKILAELESEEHKNWLVHKQTACGKDFSNPFMVDNLPKIVRFSTHLASVVKSWLVHDQTVHALASPKANDEELSIPEQTATGKGTSNPLMAGSLPKTTKPT